MFGKIIGVALVALTQFALWILLTAVILGVGGAAFGPKLLESAQGAAGQEQIMEMASSTAGFDMEKMVSSMEDGNELKTILVTLGNIPWGQLIISFFIYFILGYLLYASLLRSRSGGQNGLMPVMQFDYNTLLIGFFTALMAMRSLQPSGLVGA